MKPLKGTRLQRVFRQWLESEDFRVHMVQQSRILCIAPNGHRRWVNRGEDIFGVFDYVAIAEDGSVWAGNTTTNAALSAHRKKIEAATPPSGWPSGWRISIVVEDESRFIVYDLVDSSWAPPLAYPYSRKGLKR